MYTEGEVIVTFPTTWVAISVGFGSGREAFGAAVITGQYFMEVSIAQDVEFLHDQELT